MESQQQEKKRAKRGGGGGEAVAAAVKAAARLLRNSTCVLIAAGAGMSLDSGLPDYRCKEQWEQAFPELASRKLRYEDMAQAKHFEESPRVVWAWYKHRHDAYRDAQPHPGYHIVKQWCDQAVHGARVFTSNVDGFFQRTGFPRSSVVECHGSLTKLQCCAQDHGVWKSDATFRKLDNVSLRTHTIAADSVPKCRAFGCGHAARPNILLFNDSKWTSRASAQQRKAFDAWLQGLPDDSVLAIVEVGAGTTIPTVRLEVERVVADRIGRGQQTHVIRINPEEGAGGMGVRGKEERREEEQGRQEEKGQGREEGEREQGGEQEGGEKEGGEQEGGEERESEAREKDKRQKQEVDEDDERWRLRQWPGEHVLVRARALEALTRIHALL